MLCSNLMYTYYILSYYPSTLNESSMIALQKSLYQISRGPRPPIRDALPARHLCPAIVRRTTADRPPRGLPPLSASRTRQAGGRQKSLQTGPCSGMYQAGGRCWSMGVCRRFGAAFSPPSAGWKVAVLKLHQGPNAKFPLHFMFHLL